MPGGAIHQIRDNRFLRRTPRQWGFVTFLGALWLAAQSPVVNAPPKTRTDNVKEVIHGIEIVDSYRWLENRNDPETQAWIEAQNDYTHRILNFLPGREQLKQRLTELLRVDVVRMPMERNGHYFFSKRLANQDLFVIYMRQGINGNDEVLIDPHPMSPDHNTSVSLLEVSKDGSVLAYGVRQGGEDEMTIHLLDVNRRKDLPEQLPRARYFGVALKPDKSGFYYSRQEPEGPRILFHSIGTDPARDVEVFGKGYGPDKIIVADLSENGRYLIITVVHGSAADKTEIYYQDLARRGPIAPVVNDLAARFLGSVAGGELFLQTNWKAPNGRVLSVDLNDPGRDHWRETIPESDAVIEDFAVAGGKLFVNYLQNVTSRVEVFDPGGRRLSQIAFPTLGTVSGISGRWESKEAFFEFSSFQVPTTLYRYDVSQGIQDQWARLNVPVDKDKFELKQVWYESRDRTKVPMFLLHAKGLKLDGSHPTLLTGYGGFNISLTPQFSSTAVLWAERGGIFAVPNLRGGGEFGEKWHQAGMREKKQNVFDDFIAAAEWLVKNGYTKPSRLAISGRSNGGLLVGAALTQRPDLFRAVVCGYPLLDMLRYQNFLVAKFWVPEYGSSEDPSQFKYLYAYSPYHRVKLGANYPAILFVTGDADTRVDPLHARKMAALLQSAAEPHRPVLLHYNTKSGHTSAQPVGQQIDDMLDELSFLYWQLQAASETDR